MFVLQVSNENNNYDEADIHGPFPTVASAQAYAEDYREMQGLPREATPENNESWTDAGWYFGIVQPRLLTGITRTPSL